MRSDSPSRPRFAAETTTLRKVPSIAHMSIRPEQELAFLREPPALPGWLLIFLYAGVGAAHGWVNAWTWIACSAAIALSRVPLAVRALAPNRSAQSVSTLAVLFLSAHVMQAAMWVLLLGPLGSPQNSPVRTATSLAAGMLLSATCLRGWRAGWLAVLAGWSIAVVITAIWLWDSMPAASIALLLWLPATAWAGIAPATSPMPALPVRPTRPVTVHGGSTRRGAQLAIHAARVPMIGVYDGRIFDMNRSAEAFLGQDAAHCLGRPALELLKVDPPSALDGAYPAAARQALISPQRPEGDEVAAQPALAHIQVGRSGDQKAIAVVALDVNAERVEAREPSTDAPLADHPGAEAFSEDWQQGEAIRSDLLSKLPVLIWLIDGSGRVVQAHASDVQRWGLRIEPSLRPAWTEATALEADSQKAFARAVQQGLDGRPTFDLLNYREARSGGRLALRSHFVPFLSPAGEGKTRHSVLIMDTIASVRELLEYERLRLSKAQYKDLVEASPNLIWACDEAFRFTFVSRRACRDVYGHAVEDLLGAPMSALLDPGADQTAAYQALVGLRKNRSLRDVPMPHITKDRRHITVVVSAVALRAPDGTFAGAIGINVDMTALKQREARLAEALRVERSVLDSAGQAIAVVKSGAVARCNDAFLQLLQMRPDELAAVPVADLFAERSHWNEVSNVAERASSSDGAITREIRVRRASPAGTPEQFLWCQITLRAIGEGEYVVALADIDLIRRREAHAQHDARHDDLTGLPNRRLLSERVRAALATSALRNSGCAILVFDLDGFKPINDRFGHSAGDVVLREVARRLQNIVRPQDTVARIGGDEFALLMPDCGSTQDVERIARRILREVEQPLTGADLGGANLTASLGVVLAPEHGCEPEWLMRLADRAMYDAKVEGGNRVVFSGIAAATSVFDDQVERHAS
jgi:diguanylate cyclase (GGDEF)-like protein/PAS domain S-box-containing protein